MLHITKNIGRRSLRILYILVLRAGKPDTVISIGADSPVRNTNIYKISNFEFAGLYFHYFTTLRHQILQFYQFQGAHSSCDERIRSYYLDQNLVYRRNYLLITYTDRRWSWSIQAVIKFRLRPRRCIGRAWIPGPTMERRARSIV